MEESRIIDKKNWIISSFMVQFSQERRHFFCKQVDQIRKNWWFENWLTFDVKNELF